MDPVRFSVERPYTVAVAVILALLFSLLAFQRIPVQLKPTVDAPVIGVTTVYRGASPVEVEEQITREIEDLLQGVDGLETLTSNSLEGVSNVILEYQWGVDKDRAVIDVINKLSQLPPLPADAEEPVVSLTDAIGETAMWLRTESHYTAERVRLLIEEEVKPRIERVPGVSGTMIVGGEEREIQVFVDPERLAARDVTFEQLASALFRGHVDLRGGTVETGTRRLVVRTEGRSADPQDLAAIVVRRGEGGTVSVGDVATIVDGYREKTSVVHANEPDNVAIGVGREPGANVVELIEALDADIVVLNRRFAEQGLDLRLIPVYRDTDYLEQAIEFVTDNLLLGAGLAVGVLLLFLRSLRSVVVVAVAIPISLATVFLVMDALDRTLNVISLAGLAFASGMVVDNAIVVLENIFRHLERGSSARQAAIEGGREVWGGVLAATLTTIAVFVPILAIKEEAGQLFADLALAISAAVGLSLVVALCVVPPLAALLYRRRGIRSAEARADGEPHAPRSGRVAAAYGRAVGALVSPGADRVMLKLAVLLLVTAFAVLLLRLVPPAGYLPSGNRNMIFFIAQPIPGTRPETLAENAALLEDWIVDQPETDRYFLVLAQGFNGGGVILKQDAATGQGLDQYLGRMLGVTTQVPGFLYMIPMRTSLFRDSGKQFTVEITGPDLDRLATIATDLQTRLGQWKGVQPMGVQSDFIEGRPELKVHVDGNRAAEMGMSVREVGAVVETALAGRIVGTFSDGGRDYDVNLVVPAERVSSDDELSTLPMITSSGARTTLGALARIERTTGPQSVNRLERQRAITLTVNLQGDAVLQAVLEDVQARLVGPLRAGLMPDERVELGGSADKFTQTLATLTGSFWLAVFITYLLLVALFRSWLSPAVILVSVPLALSGGLAGITLAHRFSPDATFDLLSMLGFVILAGVVVNNAILIVHQANNLRELGIERRAALIESSRTRLRPILMSVTTTVFAMLPLAVGRGAGAELYQGLAAVVVGGLLVSTLFTLFLVPSLLSLGWDVAEAFGHDASLSPATSRTRV